MSLREVTLWGGGIAVGMLTMGLTFNVRVAQLEKEIFPCDLQQFASPEDTMSAVEPTQQLVLPETMAFAGDPEVVFSIIPPYCQVEYLVLDTLPEYDADNDIEQQILFVTEAAVSIDDRIGPGTFVPHTDSLVVLAVCVPLRPATIYPRNIVKFTGAIGYVGMRGSTLVWTAWRGTTLRFIQPNEAFICAQEKVHTTTEYASDGP